MTAFNDRKSKQPHSAHVRTEERKPSRSQPGEAPLTVFVRLPTGRTQQIRVLNPEKTTLDALVARLPYGVSEKLCFAMEGQPLRPAETLAALGVRANSTLHVSVPLLGGSQTVPPGSF